MTPLPISDAAKALGIPASELRHWIHSGAPVARRGGRGRGNKTLLDPEAVRAWRIADPEQQLVMALAAELPDMLAAALVDAHAQAEGVSKQALAGIFTAAWYAASTRLLDHLRERVPAIPEIVAIPPDIARLRAISRR